MESSTSSSLVKNSSIRVYLPSPFPAKCQKPAFIPQFLGLLLEKEGSSIIFGKPSASVTN